MAGELLLRRDFAACACGCGLHPPEARYHHRGKGIRKGERLTCVPGHQGRLPEKNKPQLPDGNPAGTCKCGCGRPTSTYRYGSQRGNHFNFVQGHQRRWEAQQRALRKPQGRRLCVTCYQDRPAVAFLDRSSTCIICLAKKRKAAPIWEEVDQRAEAAAQGRASRARQSAYKAIASGNSKRGKNITVVSPKRERL